MNGDPSGEQRYRRRRARSNSDPVRDASPQPETAPASPAAYTVTETTSTPPNGPEAPEHLIVGQVAAAFGLHGEMKVNILTEFPERLSKMEEVVLAPLSYIGSGSAIPTGQAADRHNRPPTPRTRNVQGFVAPRKPTAFPVESTRVHKGQLLLKVGGIDTPEAVEMLRSYWVLVPREKAKKLPKGAYYLYELEGLEVYDTGRRYLGKIVEVLTLTANDVYVVRGPGVTDPTGELLVPAIKAVVKRMEMKRGRIIIAPPEEWT